MIDKANPKWTNHKEMHDYQSQKAPSEKFTNGTRLSARHNFELLDTPFGKGVEQSIETAEEYSDRTNDGAAED